MIWKNWTRHLGAKILAFLGSAALWLTVTNQIESDKTLLFPIEYVNRPPGLSAMAGLPKTVEARVRGRGRFLRYTTRGGACVVDLEGSQIGKNTFILDGSNVTMPSDAGVNRIEVLNPRRIVLEFDETVVRDIPITPTVTGSPDPRYVQVGKTFLNPAAARVRGPRRLVDEIALLATEPIEIRGHRHTVRKNVRLVSSGNPAIEITPQGVEIGITIEPLVEEVIEGVALEFAGELDADWITEARPSEITVSIRGARSIVDVATRDVTSVALTSDAWSEGVTILRLLEVRGRDLVFAPHESFPLVMSPSPDSGEDPQGANASGPELPPHGRAPSAVRGEVPARLPFPREVEILSVEPDRFAVSIREATDQERRVARNAGAGGNGGERAPRSAP